MRTRTNSRTQTDMLKHLYLTQWCPGKVLEPMKRRPCEMGISCSPSPCPAVEDDAACSTCTVGEDGSTFASFGGRLGTTGHPSSDFEAISRKSCHDGRGAPECAGVQRPSIANPGGISDMNWSVGYTACSERRKLTSPILDLKSENDGSSLTISGTDFNMSAASLGDNGVAGSSDDSSVSKVGGEVNTNEAVARGSGFGSASGSGISVGGGRGGTTPGLQGGVCCFTCSN